MVAYALPAVFAACLVLATLPQLLAEPYPRIVTGQTVDVGSNVRLRAHDVQRARRLYILFLPQNSSSVHPLLRRGAPTFPQVLTLLAPSFTWLLLLTAVCVGAAWLALRAVFAADAKNPVKAFFTRLFATEED